MDLYYENKKVLSLEKNDFEKVISSFKIIEAAGGIVKNSENKTLLILRREHWDLPKGKIESNETIETAALREVEEETGVKNLIITKEMPATYHLMVDFNGEISVKKTFWFEMKSDFKGKLIPQNEEDIVDVDFFDKDEIQSLKYTMYPTIISLLFP